jgi:hypothetical protein
MAEASCDTLKAANTTRSSLLISSCPVACSVVQLQNSEAEEAASSNWCKRKKENRNAPCRPEIPSKPTKANVHIIGVVSIRYKALETLVYRYSNYIMYMYVSAVK